MRRYAEYFITLFLLLSLSGCAAAAQFRLTKPPAGSAVKSPEEIVIKAPIPRLPEHERLTYQVSWLGMRAGTIMASINGIKKINGRDSYEIEVTIKTSGIYSLLYKVDDRFVSYMDVEKLCTVRHELYRRERRYRKEAITDFDQKRHKAYFKDLLTNAQRVIDIPPNVQDTLSACYYFRTLPVEIGKEIEYAVYNNEAIYDLIVVAEKKEWVRTPNLGSREAFYIQPYAKLRGATVKKGRVSGYFDCGEKRMPLLAIVQAPVFTEVIAYLDKAPIKDVK